MLDNNFSLLKQEELKKDYLYLNFYTGFIEPLENIIFVFGSNLEGRHGAGAAKEAVLHFKAIYGQSEGIQGNAYAIPTKDLQNKTNNSFKSVAATKIIISIINFYKFALINPSKNFCIAYRNKAKEKTLNGYNGNQMVYMFYIASLYMSNQKIPDNIYFYIGWKDIFKELFFSKN